MGRGLTQCQSLSTTLRVLCSQMHCLCCPGMGRGLRSPLKRWCWAAASPRAAPDPRPPHASLLALWSLLPTAQHAVHAVRRHGSHTSPALAAACVQHSSRGGLCTLLTCALFSPVHSSHLCTLLTCALFSLVHSSHLCTPLTLAYALWVAQVGLPRSLPLRRVSHARPPTLHEPCTPSQPSTSHAQPSTSSSSLLCSHRPHISPRVLSSLL
jgi:hypothetical protein